MIECRYSVLGYELVPSLVIPKHVDTMVTNLDSLDPDRLQQKEGEKILSLF